jgi:hypothetical protein
MGSASLCSSLHPNTLSSMPRSCGASDRAGCLLLVGLDGRDGAGKSSCGSWLSWQLNMPCVHLDTYVAEPSFRRWHVEHMRQIIEARLSRKLPVIVEGCLLLRALAQIDRRPDFLMFVENSAYPGSALLHETIEAYLAETRPQEAADFFMRVYFEGPIANQPAGPPTRPISC